MKRGWCTVSPRPDVLQSLTESVQPLSTELKSLRQETTELRPLVRPPTSRQQKAPTVPPLVTLPELRAMTDLAQTVDRRVDQLGVACSDDGEFELSDSTSGIHLILVKVM